MCIEFVNIWAYECLEMENSLFLLANSWPPLVILRNVPKFHNFFPEKSGFTYAGNQIYEHLFSCNGSAF